MTTTIKRNHAVLVVVDVQERLMPAIDRRDEVLDGISRLIAGCRELGLPILVTEQYPKGLGQTVPEIREALGEWYRPIEKLSFSACGDIQFVGEIETVARRNVILCGAETHVCIYQTARDLRNLGYEVEVVADAVGSRSERNYRVALDRFPRHNIDVTSVEMVLFEMMVRADIPEFKAVSKIVK